MRQAGRDVIIEAHPGVLYRARFDLTNLGGVRRVAAARLHMTGLLLRRAHDVTLAMAELLNNAIEHGGGHGEITLTDVDDQLRCRISDEGPGFTGDPYLYRVKRPDPTVLRGRGLWTVFTLRPTATVHTTRYGTHVGLTADLPKRRVV